MIECVTERETGQHCRMLSFGPLFPEVAGDGGSSSASSYNMESIRVERLGDVVSSPW